MIEAEAKRAIEDERRKLNLETTRKLREAEESSKTRINLNEAKMHQIRVTAFMHTKRVFICIQDILAKNSPRKPTAMSRTPHTPLKGSPSQTVSITDFT